MDEDDNKFGYNSLLNKIADDLATDGIEDVTKRHRLPVNHHHYPGAVISVRINGDIVSNKIGKMVKAWSMKDSTKAYLKEKYGWGESTFNLIEWKCMEER